MKGKKTAALAVLVLLPFVASDVDFSYGVRGGVGHFSYYGSGSGDVLDLPGMSNGLKLGVVAGLFTVLPGAEAFSLQPELLLAFQGDKMGEDASAYGP